jgi:flagellar protein FliS
VVVSPYEKYKKTGITTASGGKLILMLYDGAIRFLNQSLEGLKEKKYDVVNNNIIKGQNILTELMLSLNMNVGEIAENLYSLYDYMNRRLIEANIKKDDKVIKEVLGMLTDLRATWEEAIKRSGQKVVKEEPEEKKV